MFLLLYNHILKYRYIFENITIMKVEANKYSIKGRIWLEGIQGPFLGEGKISLLKAIEKLGSINKAAKSMNMSYKKAWKLVEAMNQRSNNPLVIRTAGGKDGGGTQLTDSGEKAIKQFNILKVKLRKFLDKESAKLSF